MSADRIRLPRIGALAVSCALACSACGGSGSDFSGSSGNSSGGSTGDFWIPYTAAQFGDSTGQTGQTGLFVIPSNALTTAPAFITTAFPQPLGYGQNITFNGDTVIAASPATYLYAAADSNNESHVYGLNLASAATPTATQISSLSLPQSRVICDFHASFGNVRMPSTLFVVLHVAGATGCNTSGDVWEVVHYTDSAVTAPTVLTIGSTSIYELYAPSGALTGLVLRDPASNNLYEYGDDSFTSPTTLIGGGLASSVSLVYDTDSQAPIGSSVMGTVLFLAVTLPSQAQSLYRVAYSSATATQSYPAAGSLGAVGVGDGSNVYFTDTVNGSPSTETIWQQNLAGDAPIRLYNYTVPSSATTVGQSYDLIGSNGAVLVIRTASTDINTSVATSTLGALPVGALSDSATALSGSYTGTLDAVMLPTTVGMPSTDQVLIDVTSLADFSYSSEVLTPSGTVKQAPEANSFFLFNSASPLSGSILQVTGITNFVGAQSGGPINAVNLVTLAATPLKAPGGMIYTVPNTYDAEPIGLSSTIGAGALVYSVELPVPHDNSGLAYDLSKSLIVEIDLAGSSVASGLTID